MEHPRLSSLRLVADLLAETPALADLFLELRLDCLGCSMTKFCTLKEVCRQYNLELAPFLQRIQEWIDKP
jgi:hypothetical protein